MDVRKQAMYPVTELGSVGSALVPELIPALFDPAVAIRRAAARALEQIDP